jgi:glutamine synthetase
MPMQIKTLRIFFTDLLGVHREVVALGRVDCSDAVIGVDGSSLYGYARVEKSDVFVAPASSSCIDIGEDGEVFAAGVVCLDSSAEIDTHSTLEWCLKGP